MAKGEEMEWRRVKRLNGEVYQNAFDSHSFVDVSLCEEIYQYRINF